MTLKNTEHNYGSIAKTFHWLTALLIVAMIILGLIMRDSNPVIRGTLYTIHKSTGLTLLFMTLLRLIWKSFNKRPKLPSTISPVFRFLASFTHTGLYLLMLGMTLSGWIMSTASNHAPDFWWLFKLPAPWVTENPVVASFAHDTHEICAWIISGLIIIHTIAALKHHFISKDHVLRAMLPFNKKH